MASAAHLAKSGASWFTNILRFSGVRRLEAIPGYERRIPNWVKPKAMDRRRRVTRPVNDAEERHLQILRMGLRFFVPPRCSILGGHPPCRPARNTFLSNRHAKSAMKSGIPFRNWL